ncbi:hypothetical protein GQX73_g180 [Xylaria multiplex]|uniref:Uncharacterized protein n=1 Tax=Xylaria multiplex TaxID=323545 RepID=A0A7C8IVK5_9PEZI|nr:hypothetical protein GQX73_g180 [Xylaria multiplex]
MLFQNQNQGVELDTGSEVGLDAGSEVELGVGLDVVIEVETEVEVGVGSEVITMVVVTEEWLELAVGDDERVLVLNVVAVDLEVVDDAKTVVREDVGANKLGSPDGGTTKVAETGDWIHDDPFGASVYGMHPDRMRTAAGIQPHHIVKIGQWRATSSYYDTVEY